MWLYEFSQDFTLICSSDVVFEPIVTKIQSYLKDQQEKHSEQVSWHSDKTWPIKILYKVAGDQLSEPT